MATERIAQQDTKSRTEKKKENAGWEEEKQKAPEVSVLEEKGKNSGSRSPDKGQSERSLSGIEVGHQLIIPSCTVGTYCRI
jgi:hypothetical protein